MMVVFAILAFFFWAILPVAELERRCAEEEARVLEIIRIKPGAHGGVQATPHYSTGRKETDAVDKLKRSKTRKPT